MRALNAEENARERARARTALDHATCRGPPRGLTLTSAQSADVALEPPFHPHPNHLPFVLAFHRPYILLTLHRPSFAPIAMPEAQLSNESGGPTAPSALLESFPSFDRLPPEIATRIITLAYRSPELSCIRKEDIKKRSRLALDVQTTLSLTLVSKSVAKVANATLYETIRLTKPSALLELHATLDAKPELAKLIRNLHVGSEDTLPTSEWPLVFDFPRGNERMTKLLLQSTVFLTSYGAADEVPSWLKHAHRWPVEIREVGEDTSDKDGQWAAIARAVRAAVDYVDLDLYKRGYSKSGKKIGLVSDSVRDEVIEPPFAMADALTASLPRSLPRHL